MKRLKFRVAPLWSRLRNSPLARNASWMLVGYGCRAVIQAGYFVLIARALGADGYGAFIAVVALVWIAAPFASWGTGNLLIQRVTRDPAQFGQGWGIALAVTAVFGTILTGLAVAASVLLLPRTVSFGLVAAVGFSDLLFAQILGVAGQSFQAFQQMGRTAALQVWLSIVRLLAAAILALGIASPTPMDWGIGYLLSSAVAAVGAIGLVTRELGRPRFWGPGLISELRQGFWFSAGMSAYGVYNDIDKTLLARLATLHAAGIYGAAYKVLDLVFAPVLSLLYASYPQFFLHGATGVRGGVRLARKLLPAGTLYAALAGALLYLGAPSFPYLLGADYQEMADVLRWLALLPLLKTIQYLGADTLTGAGRQMLRSGLYMSVAALNVGLNLWLIPRFSWRGAAWATLVSDAVLALAVWSVVSYLWRREQGPEDEPGIIGMPAEARR